MSEKLRVGFLYTAKICTKNANAIEGTDNCILTVVGSRTVDKAAAFIEKLQVGGVATSARAVGSYQAVIDDDNVDCVYIPLPTGLHLEWVEKALAKGKHVLLEKPVTLNEGDLDKLVAMVRDHGNVQIMDGTMWTHHPRTGEMYDALQQLGGIRRINSAASFLLPEEELNSNVRGQKDLDGLGVLGDVGWYCIRAILWAKGYVLPEAVRAHGFPRYNEAGVVVSCGATLSFADGTVADFDVAFDTSYRMTLEVAGDRSHLVCNDFMLPFSQTEAPFEIRQDKSQTPSVVPSPKPQETLMWEEMAKCCFKIAHGDGPTQHWVDLMVKTQHTLNAVMTSLEANCDEVNLA